MRIKRLLAILLLLSLCITLGIILNGCSSSNSGNSTTKLTAAIINSIIEGDANVNWKAADTNITSNYNQDERKYLCGLMDAPKPDKTIQNYQVRGVKIPESFNWRNYNGQDWVTSVKDQGKWGTCVAFANIAAAEVMERVRQKNPLANVDFSEWCFWYNGTNGKNPRPGGWIMSQGADTLKNTGTVNEQNCPYSDIPTYNPPPPGSQYYKATNFQYVEGLNNMKEALQQGPIVTGMKIYEDFFFYSTGVYKNVIGDYHGNHAILIVGYNDKENCWICKNSWSTQWGESGFFKIDYNQAYQKGYVYTGIEPVSPIPTPTPTPTPTPNIVGYITQSNAGPALEGSNISINQKNNKYSTTTDKNGKFEAIIADGTYDITATKDGYATAKVEGITVIDGSTIADIHMVQMPIFKPQWPTTPPTVTITGITEGQTITPGETLSINIKANDNSEDFPIKLIQVMIGNQRGALSVSSYDTSNITYNWNTGETPPPPGESYIKVIAYDQNNNCTVKYIRIKSSGTTSSLPAPEGVYPQIVTYARDFQTYANIQAEVMKKIKKNYDPKFFTLPNGTKIEVKSVPANANIIGIILFDSVNGATGYRIYRSTKPDTGFIHIGDNKSSSNSFLDYDPQLTPGITYYYRIAPYNADGVGAYATSEGVTVLDRFAVNIKTPENGAENVSITPTFTWEPNKLIGDKQFYAVGLFEYNGTDFAWVSEELESKTSVKCDTNLKKNTVYEWDLWECVAVGSYNESWGGYTAYSFSTLLQYGYYSGSYGGSHIFTTGDDAKSDKIGGGK